MNGSNKCQRGKRNDNILLLNINLNPIVGRGGMRVQSVLQALAKKMQVVRIETGYLGEISLH
jgi:hypothetical protein